jgi:hypothetical protein
MIERFTPTSINMGFCVYLEGGYASCLKGVPKILIDSKFFTCVPTYLMLGDTQESNYYLFLLFYFLGFGGRGVGGKIMITTYKKKEVQSFKPDIV